MRQLAKVQRRSPGNDRERNQRGHDCEHGREDEQRLVHAPRHEIFLDKQLHAIGQRLQQTQRPRSIGPNAVLRPRTHLAFKQNKVRGPDEQNVNDDENDDH
jgi:hypothetical protein